MARQILFRGKDSLAGEWVFGSFVNFEDEAFVCPQSGDRFGLTQVDFATVGQFSGLVDKNGKQIFEGDILSFANNYEPYFAKVIFTTEDVASCGCCYSAFEGSGFVGKVLPGSKYVYSCFAGAMSEAEIVGNIHDNPEFETKGRHGNA